MSHQAEVCLEVGSLGPIGDLRRRPRGVAQFVGRGAPVVGDPCRANIAS